MDRQFVGPGAGPTGRAAILFRHAPSAIGASILLLTACGSAPPPDVFDEIRVLENQRAGGDRLATLAHDADADVRKAACDVLGRLGGPIDTLAGCLADPAAAVRYAAAAALVIHPDPAAAAPLLPQLDAADPNLRLLAAQGLGRSGALDAAFALLPRVANDAEPAVRGAAAISIGRALDGIDESTEAQERIVGLERDLGERIAAEPELTVRWRIAWALSRFGRSADPRVIDPLRAALGSARSERTPRPERWLRVMAMRALGRRGAALRDAANGELPAFAIDVLGDADPQIWLSAVRAVRAMVRPSEPAPKPILRAILAALITDPDSRMVAGLVDALGERSCMDLPEWLTEPTGVDARPPTGDRAHTIPALVDHDSLAIRNAALVALARIAPQQAVTRCISRVRAEAPSERIAAAKAARWLPDDVAMQVLTTAFEDPDVRVRTEALRSLGGHPTAPGLDELLAGAARETDLGLREELGTVLEELPRRPVDLARTAFAASPGDEFAEARKNLLAAVVSDRPTDADAWLLAQLGDPSLAVRRAAARALSARGTTPPPFDETDAGPFPRLGAEVPAELLATQPVVEVHTSRGTFEITLAPVLAPVHVWNFVQLATRGDYDGTVFHRVVPDFVVQGGSRRGDGYDNSSWLHGRLRDELSPLPFLAGTVGMPKTADPDSGGGQFFVTLVPTPHLDQRYTAFGRVTRGLDVAESIEVGDVIEGIVVKSP